MFTVSKDYQILDSERGQMFCAYNGNILLLFKMKPSLLVNATIGHDGVEPLNSEMFFLRRLPSNHWSGSIVSLR